VTLADPDFNKPNKIDIIIGADYYGEIISREMIKIEKMLMQETKFGWISSDLSPAKQGKTQQDPKQATTCISRTSIEELNEQLK
jgi:hypothetical protein